MEVCGPAMGPERVLPNSEDELGEDERPADDALLPVWSGGEGGGEEGGEMELDGEEEEEEEEEEEVNNGGYYYQPLNQEPEGGNSSGGGPPGGEEGEEGEDAPPPSVTEQLQQVQHRIEVMGLHLPEAPPPDTDEEEDAVAAVRSRASIPMDADHVELVKRTMAAVALPSLGVPPWAQEISDDQWKDLVQTTLETRQSAAALRLPRRGNTTGP
ncbi:male-enhanced antigen 1 [Sander lucioperca]|uniref:male-enhanced antigen 1 n=1 Tax=Sander lucioperca TaxID=283035 RepID=UPI001653B226|nr:male-enhanced antigen 1 [Sander lucioperca]XP_035848347.1 male-enhanced antigen 1 [Sander lucioperca]